MKTTATEFWRLGSPQYDSDYDHEMINGSLQHPFGLPGIVCDLCGRTWAGSRVLPFQCPAKLRERKEITDAWPISSAAHKKLQQEIFSVLNDKDFINNELRPGDSFQPGFLDIPAIPRADFLWCSIRSLVVSQQIKDLFTEKHISNVAFADVTLRKVGNQEVKLPAQSPSTSESESLIEKVPLLADLSSIGKYYEMIVPNESDYSPDRKPKGFCKECGRPEIESYPRVPMMETKIWRGQEIFFLAGTLHIVITNSLKDILEQRVTTNVAFTKM